MNVDELYTELVLELYRNPVNKKILNNVDTSFRDNNPFCGDVVEIQVKFNNNSIKEIGFQGEGCAISQAAASVVTEIVKGKNTEDVLKLQIGDVLKELHLESLKNNPVRIKCAALSLKVLKLAVLKYFGKKEAS